MIGYKWTIKKDNKYFSLMNFRIYASLGNVNCQPYELYKTYSNYIVNLRPTILQKGSNIAGFHFWKKPKINNFWEQYNRHLKYYRQPEINAILKCKINKEDILYEDENRIVAKKFIVLEETKCI